MHLVGKPIRAYGKAMEKLSQMGHDVEHLIAPRRAEFLRLLNRTSLCLFKEVQTPVMVDADNLYRDEMSFRADPFERFTAISFYRHVLADELKIMRNLIGGPESEYFSPGEAYARIFRELEAEIGTTQIAWRSS